ncbi:MAG: tetratricopeptide repeat protein, partial [Acidobacteria bacterium]|nr:tetratricopeptide repeat protein [Acidobacteriota bacterium]
MKLFRNRPDLRSEFRIHEQILGAIRRAGGTVAWTDLFVVHSGADRTPEGLQRKLERDFRLLKLDLAERPEHPFVLFNFGMTHADAGQYEEAVEYLNRSLAVSEPSESHVRKAYALLVNSYAQLKKHEMAWQYCQQGRKLYPKDPELLFREGMLSHHFGRLEEAVRSYQAANQDTDQRHFSSIDRGITSHKARHNLAIVYHDMDRPDLAESQWRQAVR